MKRIGILFIITALATTIIFSGCGKIIQINLKVLLLKVQRLKFHNQYLKTMYLLKIMNLLKTMSLLKMHQKLQKNLPNLKLR